MIKKISFLILLLTWLSVQPVQAIVDPRQTANNRFGIHIMEQDDLGPAADLVNGGGGQWGYVTLVIRFNDLNLIKWQPIFDQMRRLKLIPLVRLATVPEASAWVAPRPEDAGRWAEFFNSLNWVTQNRYVILFNEPNHAKEWGNEIKPRDYALVAKEFSRQFKAASADYFILPAGFDTAAPNGKETMAATEYWRQMSLADSDVFTYFDGWNSHSYPNPNFSGPVFGTGLGTITSYRAELNHLSRYRLPGNLPVFITETGWLNSNSNLAERYRQAYTKVWTDGNLVAVTPFVLNYPQSPFNIFSWRDLGGTFRDHYLAVKDLPKVKGEPAQLHLSQLTDHNLPDEVVSSSDYHFFLEWLNEGQSIWAREDFTLKVSGNIPADSLLIGHVNSTEPGQTARVDVNLKTPGGDKAGESLKLSAQLVYKDSPFGDVVEKTIDVVPPPTVLISARSLYPAPTEDNRYRLLVYDTDNQLIQETSAADFGRFEAIELYNLVPGRPYRLVLLKRYYLPRQTWVELNHGANLAYFKPLLPLDFDQSGHLSWADFWAWLLLPINYLRFALQPGN
jgi:hypothetical protein